jgi:mannose-6-phosphate isomerase-like protein (cupin superfamily)
MIEQGDFEFAVEHRTHSVSAGDVVYIPRCVFHAVRNIGCETGMLHVVSVGSGGCDLEAFFRSTPMNELATDGIPLKAPLGERTQAQPVIVRRESIYSSADCDDQHDNLNVLDPGSLSAKNLCPVLRDSAKRFRCDAMTTPSRAASFVHLPKGEDNLFAVQSGLYEFSVDDARLQIRAGDVLWTPRAEQAAFRVISEQPGTALLFSFTAS